MKQKYVSNSVLILFPESMRPKFCICIPESQSGQFKDMKVYEGVKHNGEKHSKIKTITTK
jgi:hypothetical protein